MEQRMGTPASSPAQEERWRPLSPAALIQPLGVAPSHLGHCKLYGEKGIFSPGSKAALPGPRTGYGACMDLDCTLRNTEHWP